MAYLQRGVRVRGLFIAVAWLCLGTMPSGATSVLNVRTAPYDVIVDPYPTPQSYTKDMVLDITVTMSAPLGAGLDSAPLVPVSVAFDDGLFREANVDVARFMGSVSTDNNGQITDVFLQVFLDAPHSPGVWVRRAAGATRYAATLAQTVQVGWVDPCAGWAPCDPEPLLEWMTDRAEGRGPVSVVAYDGGVPDPITLSSGFAEVPLPGPLGLLLAGLSLLSLRKPLARWIKARQTVVDSA